MRYSLRTEHITITQTDRGYLDKKLKTLTKHIRHPYVADVSFSKSTHHGKGDVITCSINIEQGKRVFHTDRAGNTIQNALDETIEALRSELQKYHDKKKRHGGGVQR